MEIQHEIPWNSLLKRILWDYAGFIWFHSFKGTTGSELQCSKFQSLYLLTIGSHILQQSYVQLGFPPPLQIVRCRCPRWKKTAGLRNKQSGKFNHSNIYTRKNAPCMTCRSKALSIDRRKLGAFGRGTHRVWWLHAIHASLRSLRDLNHQSRSHPCLWTPGSGQVVGQ